jgi:hypothetical protein
VRERDETISRRAANGGPATGVTATHQTRVPLQCAFITASVYYRELTLSTIRCTIPRSPAFFARRFLFRKAGSMLAHSTLVRMIAAPAFVLLAATGLQAATITATVDTPTSFRATFTGQDTNPQDLGAGNDFQIFEFNYWTVLVNLRGDFVDTAGNAGGFYEIQLTHSGSLLSDPTAPVVNTFLFWEGLAPGAVLTDAKSRTRAHGARSEFLATDVSITFDPSGNVVDYEGSIAGESFDVNDTSDIAHTLIDLKKAGTITGKTQGRTIKRTNQAKQGGS